MYIQKRDFLCRWYDHGEDLCSWEPEAYLPNRLVQAYLEQGKKRVAEAKQKQTELADQDGLDLPVGGGRRVSPLVIGHAVDFDDKSI